MKDLPPPKDAIDLYPEGEWLNYKHLRGAEPTLAIEAIGRHEVMKKRKNKDTGRMEEQLTIEGYVVFERTERMIAGKIPAKLALNVTLRKALEAMFGERDLQKNWVQKRVTLTTGRARNPGLGKIAPCVRFKGSPDISEPITYIVQKQVGQDTHTMIPTPTKKEG